MLRRSILQNFTQKGERIILKVRKEEAEYVRNHSRNVRITVTGKRKKSRHKRWYVDESDEALKLLSKFEEMRS